MLVVLLCLVFGLASAHIGAFLANPDPSNRQRLAVFALLCGLAWRPVIDAGKQYASIRTGNQEVNTTRQVLENTLKAAPNSVNQGQAELASLASEIGVQAERVLTVTNAATAGEEPKASAAKTVSTAVETLSDQAIKVDAPLESVDALFKVGMASTRVRNNDLRELSYKKLDFLAANAANPQVKERAKELALRLNVPGPAKTPFGGGKPANP